MNSRREDRAERKRAKMCSGSQKKVEEVKNVEEKKEPCMPRLPCIEAAGSPGWTTNGKLASSVSVV